MQPFSYPPCLILRWIRRGVTLFYLCLFMEHKDKTMEFQYWTKLVIREAICSLEPITVPHCYLPIDLNKTTLDRGCMAYQMIGDEKSRIELAPDVEQSLGLYILGGDGWRGVGVVMCVCVWGGTLCTALCTSAEECSTCHGLTTH